MAERIDDLHRKGYKIIQDPEQFCFGCDAVLLSGFAVVKKDENVLDLGTGTGIIPILLEARYPAGRLTGLEIQEPMVEMARRSVTLNGLNDKISIHHGDIKRCAELYKPSSFDVIITNPPYINNEGGLKNKFTPKAIARHEILLSLEDIIASVKVLKPGGRFYMIHKPHRLPEIMKLMDKYRLEPKKLRMVQPFINKPPTMVMIEAVRGANAMLKVLPALVIYKTVNEYTDEVYDIYYN